MRSLTSAALLSLILTPACAEDGFDWSSVRFGPQVMVGTSGFEFGAFAAFDIMDDQFRIRPELFIHDGDRPAGGLAFLWHTTFLELPESHALFMGPRVAYHNGKHKDDPRGEISYMGLYSMPIPPMQGDSRHQIEMFAALGLVDEDGTELAATAGAGYFYKF